MALSRQAILERLDELDDLPAFPTAITKLEKQFAAPQANVESIAAIIEMEPVLSARLLRIANSAFYSRGRTHKTARQAVVVLGLQETRKACVASAVIRQLGRVGTLDAKTYWRHCLSVAFASNIIADMTGCVGLDDRPMVFTAALLHDLGTLILSHMYPNELAALHSDLDPRCTSASMAEHANWGIDHGEIGARIARRWKLPAPIAHVMQHHATPERARPEHLGVCEVVRVASNLLRTERPTDPEALAELGDWNRLGVLPALADDVLDAIMDAYDKSASFVDAALND